MKPKPKNLQNGSMADSGRIEGIGYKKEKRGRIFTVSEAFVGLQTGVATDVRGLPGKRQVTVLSREDFNEACQILGAELHWTTRRANLLVGGMRFNQTRGNLLKIGDVLLEITGETDPCFRMDEQLDGLQEALRPHWRGGVCCRVLSEGIISLGDVVTMIS